MKKFILLFFDTIIILLILVIFTLFSDSFLIKLKAETTTDIANQTYSENVCTDDLYETTTDKPILTNEDVTPNSVIGYIYFPTTDVKTPIIQGDETDGQYVAMDRGESHDPSTTLPGENGNTVIAGHRHMSFHSLGDLVIGDPIVININNNTFVYEIQDINVVDDDDGEAIFIDSPDKDMITLYTCWPLVRYMPYNERLVIQGELIDSFEYPCNTEVGVDL